MAALLAHKPVPQRNTRLYALIPLAAGAFYPVFGWQLNPMLAAAPIGLSSVSVVTNSLRLRAFRPPI